MSFFSSTDPVPVGRPLLPPADAIRPCLDVIDAARVYPTIGRICERLAGVGA